MFKKMLSLVLALCICLTLPVFAVADEPVQLTFCPAALKSGTTNA